VLNVNNIYSGRELRSCVLCLVCYIRHLPVVLAAVVDEIMLYAVVAADYTLPGLLTCLLLPYGLI
jgi:hypothetical protein